MKIDTGATTFIRGVTQLSGYQWAMRVDKIPTNDDLVSSVREHLDEATSEVLIATQPEMLERIEGALQRCYERGTFIALCVYSDEQTAATFDYEGTATLVRCWDQELDTMVSVDHQRGVVGQLLEPSEDEEVVGLEYDTERLYGMAFLQFMSQHWDEGEEVYVKDAPSLPYECANLRDAAVSTTLHFREENTVGFSADAREAPAEEDEVWQEIEGQLSTVRQSFVAPSNNSFFGEIGLVGYVDDERVTMGGHGAYFEDYEATNIVLEPMSATGV
jgi:hypothetical protein